MKKQYSLIQLTRHDSAEMVNRAALDQWLVLIWAMCVVVVVLHHCCGGDMFGWSPYLKSIFHRADNCFSMTYKSGHRID